VSWPASALSFTTLIPPPLSSFRSIRVCVFVRRAFVTVRVRVRAALCAPHVVSPRDLWLCVLPRWQFNVNVNVVLQNPGAPPMLVAIFHASRAAVSRESGPCVDA
jgi:hypothetical protein